MDQYGCIRLDEDDAKLIRDALIRSQAVVFSLSGDQVGAMVICLTTNFDKIGVMPFGGNPTGRIYVGVYGRGCNHLAPEPTHAGYIAEKLNLSPSDAETFATFWRMVFSNN